MPVEPEDLLQDTVAILPPEYSGKVLIVDDNESLLLSLEDSLTAQGFTVDIARNAAEAFHALERETPDIIVCDIILPDLDGFQLHARIQSHPEWGTTPFVFLSALRTDEDVRFAKSLGCDDYLAKPFDPRDLISILRGKLKARRERQRLHEDQIAQFRRRVVNTLSHEFRTPLVAINTGTEILLDQFDRIAPQDAHRLLESIQRGGLRLQRLVEDFMTLQQIESGTAAEAASRYRRRVSIVALAETAIETFIDTTKDGTPQVALRPTGAADLFVEVNEVQIINALQRLLSNAYKFSGHDRLITVFIRSGERACSILVEDQGPGLPPDRVPKACNLFEQIDRDRHEQQGCGLGLTIACYFVELNGGTLHFRHPEQGTGLEVEVRLMRAE